MPSPKWPALREVPQLSRQECARLLRFGGSPGEYAIGTPEFEDALEAEVKVQEAVQKRFEELGGWTPEISKAIGWD